MRQQDEIQNFVGNVFWYQKAQNRRLILTTVTYFKNSHFLFEFFSSQEHFGVPHIFIKCVNLKNENNRWGILNIAEYFIRKYLNLNNFN